jgi:HSP20 family protein
MREQTKATIPIKKSTAPASLKLVPPADLFDRMAKIYDAVARRAFELFEHNGRNIGRDLEDWFRAESELLHPVHIDIAETDDALSVHAEVPGFTEKDLEISVEPRRLTISGRRETTEEKKNKKVLYQEHWSDQIMRVIDLPVAVDGNKATATVKNGMLEMKLPKAPSPRKVRVQASAEGTDPEC